MIQLHDVCNGRSWYLVGVASTGRLEGETVVVCALENSFMIRNNLLCASHHDEVLGADKSSDPSSGQVDSIKLALLANGADGGEENVGIEPLSTEILALGSSVFGQRISLEIAV